MHNIIEIAKPHDALFKAALSDLTIARDFLAQYLPSDIRDQFNLATLKLAPSHMISKELRLSETDILFTINFKDQALAKRPVYIFMHLEHQSTVFYDMALRVIQYKLKVIEQARKFDPKTDLPVIWSIVVYNGKAPYTAPTDFYELFGRQKELAKQEMFNGYQLIDLSQIADDELAMHKKASLVEWVMKHVHDRDFMTLQEVLINFLKSYHQAIKCMTIQDEDHLLSISYYLLSEANIALEAQDRFLAIMKRNLSQAVGEKMTSLAYQIEQRGIQQGRQAGLEEGILQGMEKGRFEGKTEGRLEGQHELLTEVLKSKFGVIARRYVTFIKKGSTTQLIAWTKKAIIAQNLEDVFEDKT